MTAKSNNSKKPSTKKSAVKKTSSKKSPTKKKPAANSAKEQPRTEIQAKIEQAKPQFVTRDNFLKAAASSSSSLVRANDVKSPSIRKRMLAWFKIYK